MFFQWFRDRRRRSILAEPFPEAWLRILDRNVYHYADLAPEERVKLQDDLRILYYEKNWEGCGGLALTDEIKVTIAAEASLLLLGFENQYFDMVLSILVYPDAYVAHGNEIVAGGLVVEGESDREGEAWYRGPVVLSWMDALAGARGESGGDNLVLHEFAHQLDMQNGRIADGTPPLESLEEYRRWEAVLRSEYDRLVVDCRRRRPTLIDCYGTTSPAEFFAVVTECFFEQPQGLSRRHPELYRIFRDYYRQDPAHRGGKYDGPRHAGRFENA